MLNEIDGVTCVEPEGAFYAFPSVKGLLGRSHPGGRSGEQRRAGRAGCIDEAKVAVVPGEAFGAPGYFRMSYALGDDDLVEGVSRLAKLFGEAREARQVGGEFGGERKTMRWVYSSPRRLAESGLDLMAEAGHEVDVQEGLPRGAGGRHRRAPTP
jgi:hypothetical protein